MLSSQELHEKILYPVVRVRSGQGGGSGVIVHSSEDPDNPGEFINIAITCQHVVDSSIKMRDEWDPVLKRQRKSDYFEAGIHPLLDKTDVYYSDVSDLPCLEIDFLEDIPEG